MGPFWRWTPPGWTRIVLHVEQIVELTDLDEAQHVLSAAYGTMRIDGGRERSWMRMASRQLGSIRFDDVRGLIGLEVTSEPQQSYIFGHLESGRVRYRTNRDECLVAPGDAFLTAQPDLPYTAAIEDPRAMLVMVDQSVVDGVVDGARFGGGQAVSACDAEAWRSTCVHLRDQVLVGFAHEPLVVANATRLLVAATLATFPHCRPEERAADRRDAHPSTVRRAIAFMEANATKDITAVDIARAARVSIRAVQLAFRRHLNMTPMAYLRRVRLSCAHADLRAANGTVTTIAARWGYARPSVFAAHYRAAYGVSPSKTLRSR
ncbi:helix-turn-helix transcriptional regulator [Lentzea nigeriaca]|uniref:helix-turn-helix transcriptional regulator n=1 Tax=Lentzea nigeriaca TaxID=1128665 RepID=UPI00195EBE76|nr:helix-turn-helix transcriptional regulator [Lentzea nigeriaca]MBM7864824.1 AraC-like DNA-binding protein [Lentzea nigeriaca]